MNSLTEARVVLKWDNFKLGFFSNIKTLQHDPAFSDVTLVCDNGLKISAHKIILAAASPLFNDLLQQSDSSKSLLYFSDVNHSQLKFLMDLMYSGEVTMRRCEFEDFVKLSEELQMKGAEKFKEYARENRTKANLEKLKPQDQVLEQAEEYSSYSISNDTVKSANNYIQSTSLLIKKEEDMETKFDSKCDTKKLSVMDIDLGVMNDELNAKISSMMTKVDRKWTCTVCGKIEKQGKANMVKHIEGKHIEGASHPCYWCGNVFRSRNSLCSHMSQKHSNKHVL